MGNRWQENLKFDPLPPLLESQDEALVYFTRRDVLGQTVGSVHPLWQMPAALKILKKQQPDGSWPWKGVRKHPAVKHEIIETWRYLRFLVEQYGFTREHPQVERAAEYLFSCQTEAGDFRGIMANQYATYYSGAILAVLIEGGYADDPRTRRGFEWLLAMRQDDMGWTIPMLTHKLDRAAQYRLTTQFTEPLEPDRSKPFSHNWTGMILRAFAVHPAYRTSEAAWTAARLLKSRFFQPDAYTSLQSASYWVRFEYPFWWNNLVSALDSLTLIGFGLEDEDIRRAAAWLVEHQQANGLWRVSYMRPDEKEKDSPEMGRRSRWVSLAVCRVLSRLHGE